MSTFTPERAAALDGPAWLQARRRAAAERFAAGQLPTTDDELWRYTPVKQLSTVLEAIPGERAQLLPPERGEEWVGGVEAAATVVIVDGRLVSADVVDAN